MWNSAASEFHLGAWLLWLVPAMLAALGTRNPFYLALVLIVGIAVNSWLGRSGTSRGGHGLSMFSQAGPSRRGWGMLVRAMAGLFVLVALLKGLSLHTGAIVLFRLPEEWPVIGGPITLESMVWSGLDALSLIAVLVVFAAFSAGADYYALLRSVPQALHQVGLVTSIAITFVPQMVTRFAEIREAQALRGHRVRRAGDLVPLIMPLLSGGMERSLNLAEAMEARGFSRAPAGSRPVRPMLAQVALITSLGLIGIGGAMLAFLQGAPWVGWTCIVAGIASIAWTLRAMGLGRSRSRYRRSVWRERDTVLTVASLAILAILLIYKFLAPSALSYYPFPRIHMPPFDPVIALALIALAAPIPLIARWQSTPLRVLAKAAGNTE